MATLTDFAPQSAATLEDFQIEGNLVPVNNRASNVNLAAYTASLSEDPESVEATYLNLTQEGEESTRMSESLRNRAKQFTATKERDALVSILTDPDIPDEQKMAASSAYMDQQSSLYGIRNIVSSEALIAESDDETEESSNSRINFADAIENVNAYHREKQILMNHQLTSQDPNMLEIGAGFLELLVPFAEQGITEQTLSAIRGGDKTAWMEALTLMGSTKQKFTETLRSVPPEERGPIIRQVIDAVNENSTIVFPDENDFVKMDFLRTALEEGYYGEGDAWIDNLISVAELTGLVPLGWVAQGVSRGARAARRGRSAARQLETPVPERGTTYMELNGVPSRAEAPQTPSQPDEVARTEAVDTDPVRRAEDAAEGRAEARRAVMEDSPSLSRMEEAYEAELAAKRYVETDVKPVSIANNYRNTNPSKARAANQLAAEDTTGQAAEALYGTNRVEATAHDALQGIPKSDGSLVNKVSMPDAYPKARPLPPSPRVMDVVADNGAIYLTDAEKVATATRVVNDFNNVAGLVTRTEMSVPAVRDIGGSFRVGVTYGPRDNGWSDGADALEKVRTSLRDYGVKEEELTLLRREGEDYVPVDKAQATEAGDYLVKVDYPYTISAAKVEDWNDLDVVFNYLDRIPHMRGARSGSMARHILDAHSMLHPNITLGANVAVDKAAQLEKTLVELTTSFTKKFNKLSKQGQAAVEKEIKRANKEGRNRTTTSLKADGFGDEEVAALQSWRETWDTMYWLENQDLVKTLRNRGYQVLEDGSTDTRMFVKPISRNQAGSHQRAYDPETGKMEDLTAEDLTELYEKGGTVSSLRSPFVEGEESVKVVISRNQAGGPYSRALRDDDQILNYREGYYTVYYDVPKMVERTVTDSRGNILKQGAVATARDTSTAQRYLKRMQQEAEPNVTYSIRDTRERMRFDSDDNWNLQEAAGRVAQRVRGERLEDATSPILDESHNHVLGPVDALIRSARNVSTRVPMRDYLETTKSRAVNQYGHMFPRDQYGRPQFPKDSSEIKAKEGFSKEAADARTTVEYINSLENGYINQIDDTIKYALRVIADASGKRGMSIAERALNATADAGGPTRLARGVAFTLYLALNPLRQFVVQSHQAVQLTALAPRYVTTRLVSDMAAILEYKTTGKIRLGKAATGRSEAEIKAMAAAYDNSGLSASIDKSNLVRGSLSEIADSTSAGGYRRTTLARFVGLGAQGIAASRKAGFDVGEEINMLSSWLTHYNMAVEKTGKALTKAEYDKVSAMARSYTYNMNRAGDMPYNENSLGMIFQFMQVPHKSFLQMTTNRNLTKTQKARLATFNLVMYGGVPGTGLSLFLQPWLPQEGEEREALLQGVEGYMFNKLASLMYGEDVAIDFSSLAAVDNRGLLEFIGGLWTTDAGKILAESPAGSLVMGSNPRITQFARAAAEYFHYSEPLDQNPIDTGELFIEFGKLASGFSSAFKARVALEYGKKYNANGGVTDANVNTVEAVAAAFGFQTLHEARSFWASNEVYQSRTSHGEDVKEWYRLVKQQLAREGISNEERDFALRVLNVAAEQFKDDPRAQQTIQQQLQYDVENGDLSLFNSVINSAPWMDSATTREVLNTMPITEEQREMGIRTLDFIDNYREED
tara:strand:+ start:12300 stop:17171 length:4872 start_codon:yes stop_codon:yes gene_type:complete